MVFFWDQSSTRAYTRPDLLGFLFDVHGPLEQGTEVWEFASNSSNCSVFKCYFPMQKVYRILEMHAYMSSICTGWSLNRATPRKGRVAFPWLLRITLVIIQPKEFTTFVLLSVASWMLRMVALEAGTGGAGSGPVREHPEHGLPVQARSLGRAEDGHTAPGYLERRGAPCLKCKSFPCSSSNIHPQFPIFAATASPL